LILPRLKLPEGLASRNYSDPTKSKAKKTAHENMGTGIATGRPNAGAAATPNRDFASDQKW
jgi:hypothetical protein